MITVCIKTYNLDRNTFRKLGPSGGRFLRGRLALESFRKTLILGRNRLRRGHCRGRVRGHCGGRQRAVLRRLKHVKHFDVAVVVARNEDVAVISGSCGDFVLFGVVAIATFGLANLLDDFLRIRRENGARDDGVMRFDRLVKTVTVLTGCQLFEVGGHRGRGSASVRGRRRGFVLRPPEENALILGSRRDVFSILAANYKKQIKLKLQNCS